MTQCDPAKTSALVTAIRVSAERVRAYGSSGPGRGPVVSTPLKLHATAALLESEMRGWTHIDQVAAAAFADWGAHPGPSCRTIDFPGLQIVSTIVAPSLLSKDVQIAELRSIVTQLRSAVDELRFALESAAAMHYSKLITAEIDGILAFAAALA